MKTALGEAYIAQKMHMAGYMPVPDPGDRAERSRNLARALLEKPLKILHKNTDGYMLFPTPDEVSQLRQMREMASETKVVKRLARKVFIPRVIAQRSSSSRRRRESRLQSRMVH